MIGLRTVYAICAANALDKFVLGNEMVKEILKKLSSGSKMLFMITWKLRINYKLFKGELLEVSD